MIKIKLGQLVVANQTKALQHLGEQIPPGNVHFAAARLLNEIDDVLRCYETERRALFKRYGKPEMADGKPTGNLTLIGASPDDILAFNDAIDGLLTNDIELKSKPLRWSVLGAAQERLTINDIRSLGALIEEE
jgi:hypothetical protein